MFYVLWYRVNFYIPVSPPNFTWAEPGSAKWPRIASSNDDLPCPWHQLNSKAQHKVFAEIRPIMFQGKRLWSIFRHPISHLMRNSCKDCVSQHTSHRPMPLVQWWLWLIQPGRLSAINVISPSVWFKHPITTQGALHSYKMFIGFSSTLIFELSSTLAIIMDYLLCLCL